MVFHKMQGLSSEKFRSHVPGTAISRGEWSGSRFSPLIVTVDYGAMSSHRSDPNSKALLLPSPFLLSPHSFLCHSQAMIRTGIASVYKRSYATFKPVISAAKVQHKRRIQSLSVGLCYHAFGGLHCDWKPLVTNHPEILLLLYAAWQLQNSLLMVSLAPLETPPW